MEIIILGIFIFMEYQVVYFGFLGIRKRKNNKIGMQGMRGVDIERVGRVNEFDKIVCLIQGDIFR